MAPAPAAATIVDGGLAQTVLGTTAYINWRSIYAEAGVYWTPSHGFLHTMNVNAADSAGSLKTLAPYARLAYQKDFANSNVEVGAFGFFPNVYPGADSSIGLTDDFTDLGFDASYQYTGDGKNIYALNARYTYERQTLNASLALGDAANLHNTLNDIRINASYYWHNKIGLTVSAFDTWGSIDAQLYADNRTLKPDSTGLLFQIDGTPFGEHAIFGRGNIRIGAQYALYGRFNGASKNYDGTGTNASDNNTLRIFLWSAF